MLGELGAEILRRLQDEAVVVIRVVAMTPAQPLVDQRRQPEPQSDNACGRQCRDFSKSFPDAPSFR